MSEHALNPARWISLYVLTSLIVCIAPLCVMRWHSCDVWFNALLFGLFFISALSSVWKLNIRCTSFSVKKVCTLARLDLSRGLDAEHATAIVVPCVLTSHWQLCMLERKLIQLSAVIPMKHVYFVLLADLADSVQEQPNVEESVLMTDARNKIAALNVHAREQQAKPFFLLMRHRTYSATQKAWIGYERKRGKIHELTRQIATGSSSLFALTGDMSRLCEVQYLLIVDEYTGILPGTLQQMIGTLSHIDNQPILAANGRSVSSGFVIIQPAIAPQRLSNNPVRFRQWLNGRRDVFAEIFGKTRYLGKGLLHVRSYFSLMNGILPEDRILNHDGVESALLPVGAARDIAVVDLAPPSHWLHCKRRSRWIRGDWQNFFWLLQRENWIQSTILGRFLILGYLRDSLAPIAITLLLAFGALITARLLLVIILIVSMPEFGQMFFECKRTFAQQASLKYILTSFSKALLRTIQAIAQCPHEALTSIIAIVITCYREIAKRKLLDWEPSSFSADRVGIMTSCALYRIMIIAICFILLSCHYGEISTAIRVDCLLALWIINEFIGLFSRAKS